MTFRPPERSDAAGITDLIRAYDRANGGEMETDEDEIFDDWSYPGFTLGRDAWVAEDENGRIVAYGWVARRSAGGDYGLDGYVHPELRDEALGAELFARMEARARELGATRFVTGILGADRWGAGRLGELGYSFARTQYRMAIDLDGEPAAPAWPPGIEIASYSEEAAPAMHAVITEAFADEWGYEPQTLAEWKEEFIRRESFDPAFWFLARAGEEPAGALMGYPLGQGGWVRALGVRDAWRGRGLGLALLQHAFAAFAAAGRSHVALAVDSENPTGAGRLYRRAGMRETHRIDRYDKEAA